MRLLAAIFSVALAATAQQPTAATDGTQDSAAEAAKAKRRADIFRLLEMDGTAESLKGRFAQGVVEGKANLLKACTGCDPAFSEEWARRMEARFRYDEVMDIYVAAYLKHLNGEDILKLISLMEAVKADPKTAVAPPELKAKLTAVAPSLQSEIIGGTTQYGARLGGEIGTEIEKEHPEYTKNYAKPNKQ